MDQKLYFIAMVPSSDIRERVRDLKEELKERFGVKHALKSPAHITLQMPFRRDQAEETAISEVLEEFAREQLSFQVDLSGFDSFPPRVIFVKVNNHEPIKQLCESLRIVLSDRLKFTEKELSHKFHPHMTIATRDLSEDLYDRIWPEYESRELKASFTASGICLLKHNGRFWDIYKEFGFTQK
ncbi:2'-5' RNA ligase family protein [Sinomicrobium pectinilyticum]|uniref:2'-5' RNA ligase family protein n=1 Tax=Sinomicrobium pectinilyticum TaxID=1084421 RepID=A0A3N0EAL3_SINP1|nr:2'-5' RNA ligase family protein [Sinomicrobium pectinilyticum]RNL84907.1 2'-5' RNA ligase family protein [Sinomicrobium pectinilyticum]